MINNIQGPNFKGARGNLLVIGDVHGNTTNLPRLLKTIENNASEIFPKSNEASTANFFAIVGDWFINLSKKGFLTHPEITNGDLQNVALLKLIDNIKITLRNLAAKSNPNILKNELNVLFTLGNHDLDGGDSKILDIMRKNPMISLITNMNLEKSPKVREAMFMSDKIVKSAVYSIPDDKNPKLEHKILFVGTTIPSMDFYNPGICKGLEFYDNSNQKDTNYLEKDLQGTIKAVKDEVDRFKKANPKGAVVLMSHMGERISEIIRKNVPQINHILNGHDHKNTQSNVGKTSINSLGKDNEMIKSINLEFDDNGNLVKTTMIPYFTETTLPDGLETHPFQLFLNDFLEKDLTPLISIEEVKKEQSLASKEEYLNKVFNYELSNLGIDNKKVRDYLSKNEEFRNLLFQKAQNEIDDIERVPQGIDRLSYGNEIRYQNSYLMNYLTSAIKRTIREKYDPEIFTVAIQSSIIRGDLKDGANNLQVMKVFDGVSEDLSKLKIGEVSGKALVGMITENILDNLKSPTRNTIIHWSDIQINKSLIEAIKNGASNADYSEAIRVRNPITKEFEPIDLSEKYKMAIGEKYLLKDSIEWPAKIRGRFSPLNKTYDELFREYLNSIDYKIKVTPKTKEQRIL